MTQATPAKATKTVSSAARMRGFHDLLLAAYGPQHWWPAETPLAVILGAYLTQNTSWKAVERSLAQLRAAGVETLAALRATPLERLRELIAPSGFHTRKAPAILAFVALLDAEYGGRLESMAQAEPAALRARLLELPGVGPETADAILLYALGHAVPVADEYLRRVVDRHGLLANASADKPKRIRYESMAELTRQAFAGDAPGSHAALYNEFHALVVAVGKAHCGRTARCEGCPLAADLRRG